MNDERDYRWETTFGKWVRAYGVVALSASLECTPSAIYFWLRPRGRVVYPDPERAMDIVALSEGALTLEDIFMHRRTAIALARRAGDSSPLTGTRSAPVGPAA